MENGKELQLICPKCETENVEGTSFCQGCGAKIKWVYAERECTHCHNKWRPRTADPKNCPNCGYRLSRDNEVEIFIPMQILDEGSSGMLETTCSSCGKETRKYVLFKLHKNDPWKDVCYECLIEYLKRRQEEGDDIVDGSFRTAGMEKLEDGSSRLKAE